MSAFSFNATNVKPDEGRAGAIPAGWYPVSMDKAEQKATQDGTGAYLNASFEVLDGPYKGARIYHMFNTQNANEKTVQIGEAQLSAFLHAINTLVVTDTAQMCKKPFFVKVGVDAAELAPDGTEKYAAKNKINAFRAASDAAAQNAYKVQLAAPASAAGGVKAPPPVVPQQAAPGNVTNWNQVQAAQAAPVQQAPVQQPAQTPVPAQQPWGNAAPAQAAPVQQAPAQEAPPAWNQAPAAQAPAQAPAEQPAAAAAPVAAPADDMPAWMKAAQA
jgi:hypothetical protein